MTERDSTGKNKAAPKGKSRTVMSEVNEQINETTSKAMPRGLKSRMRTRQKLIDSARRAIAKKGFDQTTIEDITTGADVGFGTFYNHFHSKEDISTVLLLALMDNIDVIVDELNRVEEDRAVSITYIQKMFLTKALHDEVWGWLLVQAHSSHRFVSERLNQRAIRDLSEGVKRGRFDISCINTASQITIETLVSAMHNLLKGTASPGIANETVECLMRMYGLDHAEAKDIGKLKLPDYAVALFKNEKY